MHKYLASGYRLCAKRTPSIITGIGLHDFPSTFSSIKIQRSTYTVYEFWLGIAVDKHSHTKLPTREVLPHGARKIHWRMKLTSISARNSRKKLITTARFYRLGDRCLFWSFAQLTPTRICPQTLQVAWIVFLPKKRCFVEGFKPVVFNLGVVWHICRVRESFRWNIITSRFYISYMETLFVVAKITGSPHKNYSLLFHSKLF